MLSYMLGVGAIGVPISSNPILCYSSYTYR
jgi:hypothetical protein